MFPSILVFLSIGVCVCVFVCFISPFMLCSAMGLVPEIKLCMYVCMYVCMYMEVRVRGCCRMPIGTVHPSGTGNSPRSYTAKVCLVFMYPAGCL